jgi:hypothetical protein
MRRILWEMMALSLNGTRMQTRKIYTCCMQLSLSSFGARMIMVLTITFTRQRTAWTSLTQIPRSAFLDYFYKFDIDNPTKEDKEQRLFQWARRHPASPQNGGSGPSASTQNGQSTTPSSSPKKKSDSMKKGAVSKTTNLSVRIVN